MTRERTVYGCARGDVLPLRALLSVAGRSFLSLCNGQVRQAESIGRRCGEEALLDGTFRSLQSVTVRKTVHLRRSKRLKPRAAATTADSEIQCSHTASVRWKRRCVVA